jgi:hypothetical protein
MFSLGAHGGRNGPRSGFDRQGVKDHAFAVLIALSGRSPLWSGSVCFILAALHDMVGRMSGLIAFASDAFAAMPVPEGAYSWPFPFS